MTRETSCVIIALQVVGLRAQGVGLQVCKVWGLQLQVGTDVEGEGGPEKRMRAKLEGRRLPVLAR